ncbi:pilus assembly protein PilX [Lampropedia puyangensis]|uniref:Pilus assembly protein PilX n=1 Tax=Lampropedia puyangensis TaxID=1330072 RepID=A0A4S8FF55_9BURK|nr:PilX N-terminal domain-containing pilus assembly protein [Lampropedia puyangensis]THU05244.1 pilus assembly protein PilX [Lampropedia puyangensis]
MTFFMPASLNPNHKHPLPKQQGATLVVALIMLLMLLMLAITGMRAITLESRIAANLLDQQQLVEVADGALRDGERTIVGSYQGVRLAQCDSAAPSAVTEGVPCYVSEAKADTLGLHTDFAQGVEVAGFTSPAPNGFWYPRYIDTVCPKGMSATSALNIATTGCTEYYEVNAQATRQNAHTDCGANAVCLRSTVNQFIK